MKELVLFGDSLIKNINKPMSVEIEERSGVDVYNCAVGGWNTDDGVLKSSYISKLNPEFVLFSFGTNDAAPWKQLDVEKYKSNLHKIFEAFAKNQAIFFLPPPVNEGRQNPERRRTNKLQKEYSEVAKEISTVRGIAIIDSWRVFEPMLKSGEDYHDEDGVHFNDRGYEILINEIVDKLKVPRKESPLHVERGGAKV